MDPTAPKDNDKNSPGDENQQPSPVQTGQFVVSGEPGTGQNQSAQQQPPDPAQANQPAPPPQDLQANINETVAAATGQDPAGQAAQPAPEIPSNPPGAGASSPQGEQQPSPTPFTPPASPQNQPQPAGGQAPGAQPQGGAEGGGSKMNKIKIIAIILGVIVLVAIAAAVVWFFVLNKDAEQTTTTTQITPIEEPALPSPQTDSGFGDIPQATQEATEPAETEEEAQESPQPEVTIP